MFVLSLTAAAELSLLVLPCALFDGCLLLRWHQRGHGPSGLGLAGPALCLHALYLATFRRRHAGLMDDIRDLGLLGFSALCMLVWYVFVVGCIPLWFLRWQTRRFADERPQPALNLGSTTLYEPGEKGLSCAEFAASAGPI